MTDEKQNAPRHAELQGRNRRSTSSSARSSALGLARVVASRWRCFPAVPKVGVEPTRLFRTTDFESPGDVPEAASTRNDSRDAPRKDEKAPLGPPRNGEVGQAERSNEGRPSPRAVLVAALVETIGAATVAGDLHAARVAHQALGRLLEEPVPGAASVADLNSERERRGR